jgi:putative tricarboxylic transport membrane protein
VLQSIASGFSSLMDLNTFWMLLAGTLLGTIVGAIPGLGGAVLMTLLLPFIYGMSIIPAITLLLAAHTGIYFSGSITAILFNTPGAPESAATTFDGYAMTKQGKAARALGISATATTLGGWVGVVILIALVPVMQKMITWFQPSEFLTLAILAIVLIGQMRSGSLTKGLLSGLFGLMISFIGYDPITGIERFSFHLTSLYNGFNITSVALGLFAMSEMFELYSVKKSLFDSKTLGLKNPGSQLLEGIKDVLSKPFLVLRASVLGTLLGIVPGIGGLAANFISYGQAVKTSKHPEKFGTGTPEGIIAPEASSIAKEAGNLVPTIALGVPGGVGMAVLMSGFTILGIVPGKDMLTNHMDAVYAMAFVIAAGSLLASLLGLAMTPGLARIVMLPGFVLVPYIFALGYLGAYASSTDLLQVFAVVGFGLIGFVMKRYQYSMPAAMIGFILGTVAEKNLYLTEQVQGWTMLQRPLTDLMLLVILVLLIGPYVKRRKKQGQEQEQEPEKISLEGV